MDKIFLNQMKFFGYHGVFPEENKLGQRFNVDIILETDLKVAGINDDLEETINYAEAYNLVRDIVEGEPKKLVEAVAEDISNSLLTHFDRLQSCTVRVIKPDPPIPGHYDSVAVEIKRSRDGK